jgi:hypothetical protein
MFNLAIDSKLRGCDLVSLHVRDVTHGNQVLSRAMVIPRKTQRPVQFELTEPTRTAVSAWLERAHLRSDQYLFPSRVATSPHVSTRQYARIVHHWTEAAGLDSSAYGTHSMRRTKATLIYKRHAVTHRVAAFWQHAVPALSAMRRRWRCRRIFPFRSPPDDRFVATNLNPTLARPGQKREFAPARQLSLERPLISETCRRSNSPNSPIGDGGPPVGIWQLCAA